MGGELGKVTIQIKLFLKPQVISLHICRIRCLQSLFFLIFVGSTRSSSTVLKPSTSTLSNFLSASSTSPSLSSASKAYLIASASLGALYIIVFVALCSLIGIVCYKQRNLILKGDTKNNARSTDTLTSTSA